MIEIEKYLQKDEEILWKSSENVNLVYFIRGITFFIICSLFMVPLFAILLFQILEQITAFILIVVFIIIDLLLSLLGIYNYKKRKKRLNLAYNELKNYKEFVILTNKRFIRRNYYLNFKVNLSRYISENLLEKIGDIIFIKLENIKVVIIEHNVEEINFLFHNELTLSPFYIKTFKMDSKETSGITELVIKILNLERVEKYPGYERYIRKTS
ncbi:MAG: hypothetical protein JSV62_12575 [Promethearchaeota archaeon]|nr:MAG: hypothetical protein JSV62_12575 [Candidatus Lokiarchaeota archaeon]